MDRRSFLLALASIPAWRTGAAHAADFEPVRRGRTLTFPHDHGAHPQFRTEWWYVTGWLSLPDGSPLGFQATFFRVRTGIGESNTSAFSPSQLILAHAAITDPKSGRLRHDERAARVGFQRAGFERGKTGVWVGDWRLEQKDEGYQASVKSRDFAYTLSLIPHGQIMLNGDAGFSVKAADPRYASYYYSQPQLAVHGSVTIADRNHEVTGQAWLDHEWSSELLPPQATGWDWVGLNLDDGSALMAFQMRNSEELSLWPAATIRLAKGGTNKLSQDEVAFQPGRRWKSPRTGITYPVEWSLQIGQRTLQLRPLMDDQELDSRRTTGAIYWEGAVRVVEEGRETGRGYLEITGYGEKMRIG